MPRDKESLANTLKVAIGLSLVCSLVVSVLAISLRARQEENKERFRKENILEAARNLVGIEGDLEREQVDVLYERHVEAMFVVLETGETIEAPYTPEGARISYQPADYDLKVVSKDPRITVPVEGANIAGLQGARREAVTVVYRITGSGDEVRGYVLPVRGYGLWSTLWGFVAVEADGRTISGLTFYDHGETPGLGGEVDNPSWKAKWAGKEIYRDGDVAIEVVKTVAQGPYEVDGLAGATITSRGVTNMLQYWLGPRGFGPFLEKHARGGTDG